jgi:hypothetical protein
MTELIMVHGTWSNRKIWESPFAQHLAELLRPEVRVAAFEWSGRNSVTAREKASSDFIEFVKKRCSEEPSARRVVVCHSHGGSIVMRALALEPTLAIDALVCIGTPFIHVSRLEEVVPGATPPFGPVAAALGIVAVLLVAGVLKLIGVSRLRHAAVWMLNHPFLVLAGLFGAMMAYIAFVFAMLLREWSEDRRLGRLDFEETEEFVDRLLKEPDDEVWALKQRCQLPASEPVPTLLIKTPGDEAHGLLAAAQMASYLARTLYGVPLRVLGRTWPGLDAEEIGIFELPIYLIVWSAAFTWRAFVSIPILVVTALAFLPFGVEFSRLAGRVLVAAGDAPPGSWAVTYLPPFDRYEERIRRIDQYVKARAQDDGMAVERLERELDSNWTLATRGIAHSRAYNDLRSANIIATWIEERLPSTDRSRS